MDRGVEELILNNMDLVYSTIYKMRIKINDDLVSEGMIGLIRAAKKFDSSLGLKFSTYAVSYIKGTIKTYLTLRTTVVKPQRINGKFAEVETMQTDSEVNELGAEDENVESSLIVRDFMNRLTVREQIVAKGLMEEKTQKQIGDELHLSQTHICRMIRIIRYKYMTYNIEARKY